jgi:hypothetical protein
MALMTPYEFADQYLNLDTYFFQPDPGAVPDYTLDEGWQTLRVARYRLGRNAWAETLWNDIATRLPKTIPIRVCTVQGLIEDIELTPAQAHRHFKYPFVGKGSPEQAQIAIQLVYRYHKARSTPGHFVTQDFIGLDCNGFVGNYIQRVVKGQDWRGANNDADPGPTTLIGDLLDAQGIANRMTDLKDLTSTETYILGHCAEDGSVLDPSKANPSAWGHVMITQPGAFTQTADGLTIGVVEATAAGKRELRYVDYTFRESKQKSKGAVFTVWRGSKSDPMNVRVSRLRV